MQLTPIATLVKPYAISLLSTGAIIFFTINTSRWIHGSFLPLLFFCAIMISAWFGNMKAGFVAVTLGSLALYYFFTVPYYSFTMKQFLDVVQILFFATEGCLISYVIAHIRFHKEIFLHKKQEEENRKTIEELQNKLRNAKQDTALRDEFLSIASHELKTPLTTVVMQIQTTLHNIRNVSLSEFSVEHLLRVLQSMQNQTNRLSQMINDLLNISLITTHKMTLEVEEVDLATMIHDIADSFAEKLEKEGIELSVSIKDSLVGKWDKLRLEQVVDNLISNAIKYGNKKPIHIELEKHDGYALIRVIDKGIGIKETDKEEIFSLFNRGASEKDYKGLGIGLYIAQQIVTLHGGKIDVDSKENNGTTFTVFLPLGQS